MGRVSPGSAPSRTPSSAPPPGQDFREPLYLLDKPVRLEDTRSEEEKKYPELFRRKLRGVWVARRRAGQGVAGCGECSAGSAGREGGMGAGGGPGTDPACAVSASPAWAGRREAVRGAGEGRLPWQAGVWPPGRRTNSLGSRPPACCPQRRGGTCRRPSARCPFRATTCPRMQTTARFDGLRGWGPSGSGADRICGFKQCRAVAAAAAPPLCRSSVEAPAMRLRPSFALPIRPLCIESSEEKPLRIQNWARPARKCKAQFSSLSGHQTENSGTAATAQRPRKWSAQGAQTRTPSKRNQSGARAPTPRKGIH